MLRPVQVETELMIYRINSVRVDVGLQKIVADGIDGVFLCHAKEILFLDKPSHPKWTPDSLIVTICVSSQLVLGQMDWQDRRMSSSSA